MNKYCLLLAAALAVMVSASQAAVYEIQIAVKTTMAKAGTLKGNACEAAGKLYYRNPVTHKIRGLVWGGACDFSEGAIFWNETLKSPYGDSTAVDWQVLGRIGDKGTKAETLLQLTFTDESGMDIGMLLLAAQGTVKDAKSAKKDGDWSGATVAFASGTLAGWFLGGQAEEVRTTSGCYYCGKTETTVYEALFWGICDCDEMASEMTAANGTWSLKHNAKASKKYDETGDIDASYSFPKYVREAKEK